MSIRDRETKLDVPGGPLACRIVGDGEAAALLTLHGGPGLGHAYLDPLVKLGTDRTVVFFDQGGCGDSDGGGQLVERQLGHFVEEVEYVRQRFSPGPVHLLGHSWGGWLAIEYALTYPGALKSLILASTSASVPQFAREARRLKETLPADVSETLDRHAIESDFAAPEYQAAFMEFISRFVMRATPWPEALTESMKNFERSAAHRKLLGPDFFRPTGTLKDWDRQDRLSEIEVPALVTCGRFDEMGPSCAEVLHARIAESRMVVFEDSAHMPHLEETAKYLDIVGRFLEQVDSGTFGV